MYGMLSWRNMQPPSKQSSYKTYIVWPTRRYSLSALVVMLF